MRNTSIYQLQELILVFLLIVKNVSSNVNHLDHGSFLVVESNEIGNFNLDVFGICLIDHLVDLDANL